MGSTKCHTESSWLLDYRGSLGDGSKVYFNVSSEKVAIFFWILCTVALRDIVKSAYGRGRLCGSIVTSYNYVIIKRTELRWPTEIKTRSQYTICEIRIRK